MTTCDICGAMFDAVSSTHIYIGQTITAGKDGSYKVESDESYHVCPDCRKYISAMLYSAKARNDKD